MGKWRPDLQYEIEEPDVAARSTHVAARRTTYTWCTNANDYVIASSSLKVPGESEYHNLSGCILEIAEQFGILAPEILASLWIMQHISTYDLT
ncbi:hypothetical protein B0H13DRAFT_2341674 [Mycena leptocephala]|nr:hypothetical protein B0H13DRAFT_2341674 [Mycena leptocephala]